MNNGPSPKVGHALLGFRAWQPTTTGLAAMTSGTVWVPGINHSVCRRSQRLSLFADLSPDPNHQPNAECSCGLYAWHTLDELRSRYNDAIVFGAVAGWGATVVHRDGFRCEHALILALSLNPLGDALDRDRPGGQRFYERLVRLYADEYQVPLVHYEMLQLEGARHAHGVSDRLKPDQDNLTATAKLFHGWMASIDPGAFSSGVAAKQAASWFAPPQRAATAPRARGGGEAKGPQSPSQRYQALHAQNAPPKRPRAPRRLDPPV